MKFQVVEQELYRKAYKRLSKDYKHLQDDIDNFLDSVKTKSDLGIELKSNLFTKQELKIVIKIEVRVPDIG